MLKLKVELRQAIEPLVYESLKVPLNGYGERHPREADRIGLLCMIFRKALAERAAKYFTKWEGNAHWRGLINQDAKKQLMIDVTRTRSHYRGGVKMTSIHTELITKQLRSTTYP